MPRQLRRALDSARYHPRTTVGAAIALVGMLLTLHRAGWDPQAVRAEEFLAALATVVLGVFASDGDRVATRVLPPSKPSHPRREPGTVQGRPPESSGGKRRTAKITREACEGEASHRVSCGSGRLQALREAVFDLLAQASDSAIDP